MNWRVGGTPIPTVIARPGTAVAPPPWVPTVFPFPLPSGSIPNSSLTKGAQRMNGF